VLLIFSTVQLRHAHANLLRAVDEGAEGFFFYFLSIKATEKNNLI